VLPYVVLFVLFAISLVSALLMPEPVGDRSRPRLTPQRPRVPAAVRRPFLLAALAVLSSWSIGGLFLSLGPQLTATLFHSTDHLVAALGAFVLSGTGAVAQLLLGNRMAPWRAAAYGSVALAVGVLIIVASASTDSGALLLVGAVIGGAGFGLAFLGALRQLTGVIPAHHRAEVMSAFYVVAYTSLSLPAVAAGFLVTSMGLESTFELFGSIAAAIALIVALEAWRTRPAEARPASRPVATETYMP
jgi:hypothetical protein